MSSVVVNNRDNPCSSSSSSGSSTAAAAGSRSIIPKQSSSSSSSLLDDKIKKLLREKLAQMVIAGKPFETIGFHRAQLMKRVSDWIGVGDGNGNVSIFYNNSGDNVDYRHQLVGLFAKDLKENLKDVPTDNSEWTKLLNKWLRISCSSSSSSSSSSNTGGGGGDAVVVDRLIYKILAVDGFLGFKPKHLKCYLLNVLLPLRKEYVSHARGVRKMYDRFDSDDRVCGLTGTDSACVVFMALIDFYGGKKKKMMMLRDDQVRFRLQRVRSWAEGHLQQHVDYFRDIKNVDETLLKELCEIYARELVGDDEDRIGRELLASLEKFEY